MSDMDTTFIGQCVAGTASIDDMDDHVDRWHDGDSPLELHEYLGLTWDEYGRWVKDPESLGRLVTERRSAVGDVAPGA